VKHPGAILRALIDGPYGQLPNFSKVADKVILVAGGSGATFIFGVALDMIKKLGDPRKPTIEFIWTVKKKGITRHLSSICTTILAFEQKPCPGLARNSWNSKPVLESS